MSLYWPAYLQPAHPFRNLPAKLCNNPPALLEKANLAIIINMYVLGLKPDGSATLHAKSKENSSKTNLEWATA